MTKKKTMEKKNSSVSVERRVTRQQTKANNTPSPHQVATLYTEHSSNSSSMYMSRDVKVVRSRRTSSRLAKRFKETEENINDSNMAKSVNESIPMMEDARDSNKYTSKPPQVEESIHDSTSSFSSTLNAAVGNLLKIFSPALVDSLATPSRCPSQHAKMNPSTSTPAMMGAGIVEHNDVMLAATIDRGIPTTKDASNIEEVTLKHVTQNQNFEDCHLHSPPSVPDLNLAAATTTVSNIIGVQIPLGEATLASNVIEERPEESASNIEEVTLKHLTQNLNSEDCHPHSPPSVPNGDLNLAAATTTVSNIIGVQIPLGEATLASNVIEERPEESANNPNHSIGLTELADMWADDACSQDEVGFFACNSLVTVQKYRVNEASAPILRNILEKHGDIAMNCLFTRAEIRSFFLEIICDIIRTLQNTDFVHLTQVEIEKMLGHVDDCRKAGVEVGWLHERFDEIMEAKQLVKHSSTLKEARNRNNQVMEETMRDLEELEEKKSLTMEKLNAAQAEAKKIRETVSVAKAKVSCFITCSLVDGLV